MAACEFALVNQTFEKAMGVKDENLRGKDILATWLGITRSHLKVFEHVAISGTPQGFDLLNPENGKLFRCKIYRPGDQRKSLCVIFEDESKPVFEGSEGAPEIRP